MHHQAIKKPADGLQVDGRAEDGIIEAMSAKDGSRIFAVQFHPEYLSDHDAHAQRLFDRLCQAEPRIPERERSITPLRRSFRQEKRRSFFNTLQHAFRKNRLDCLSFPQD